MALKQKKSILILFIPYAFSKLSNFKMPIVVPTKICGLRFSTLYKHGARKGSQGDRKLAQNYQYLRLTGACGRRGEESMVAAQKGKTS